MTPVRRTATVLALLSVCACSEAPTAATPSGALTLFLEAMDRGAHDETGMKDAYAALCGDARNELTTRARNATALGGGRDFEPYEMLAQGRFRPHFTPVHMRERIHGDSAVVVVSGAAPGERAEVPLRRDGDHWCVVLGL